MKRWEYRPARDAGLAPAERWRSPVREQGLVSLWLATATFAAIHAALRALLRLRYRGREWLPQQGPLILVANHASHLDALLLAGALPLARRGGVSLLAAGDVFFADTRRAALSAMFLNAVPVWRRSASPNALRSLRERLLESRGAFVLFPEGTRSRDGQMGPFRGGIGTLVAGTAIPVVPCHIRGAFEAWPPGARLPRRGTVTVTLGRPLCFEAEENSRAGWDRIAARVEDEVRRLGGEPPRPSP